MKFKFIIKYLIVQTYMKKRIITTMFCIALAYIATQPLDASAASVWSFRSAQGVIENDGSGVPMYYAMP